MLGRLARTHFDIEQMLLSALSRIGNALIARALVVLRAFSFCWLALARESSMMRAHNCG